jgi:hypothetical protein
VQKLLVCTLVVWILGSVAYGIPLINRWTNIHHSQVVTQQHRAYRGFAEMVADQGAYSHDELGRLAATVVQLRGNGYPNVAALRSYAVIPGEFPHASQALGVSVTTQKDTLRDYGHFTATFMLDMMEATPAQVGQLVPSSPVRTWGNFRWQNLTEAGGALWAFVLLICMVLWAMKIRWEARFQRNFVKDLTQEGREVMELLGEILAHPDMPGHHDLKRRAENLFEEVRHGYALESAASGPSLNERLDDLQKIFRAGQDAYNR